MRFSYGRLACAVGEVHVVICVRDPHWGRARVIIRLLVELLSIGNIKRIVRLLAREGEDTGRGRKLGSWL